MVIHLACNHFWDLQPSHTKSNYNLAGHPLYHPNSFFFSDFPLETIRKYHGVPPFSKPPGLPPGLSDTGLASVASRRFPRTSLPPPSIARAWTDAATSWPWRTSARRRGPPRRAIAPRHRKTGGFGQSQKWSTTRGLSFFWARISDSYNHLKCWYFPMNHGIWEGIWKEEGFIKMIWTTDNQY